MDRWFKKGMSRKSRALEEIERVRLYDDRNAWKCVEVIQLTDLNLPGGLVKVKGENPNLRHKY